MMPDLPSTPTDVKVFAEDAMAHAEAATPGPWKEEWRNIPGFPDYQVSDFGSIRSRLKKGNHKAKHADKWRLLRPTNTRGYQSVYLPVNGKYQHKRVHMLVLLAFVGPRPLNQEIAHLNGTRADNRLVNLLYCSHVENESHKRLHGTLGLGEKNSQAVLQGWQVAEIRYLASKSVSYGQIATLFNIDHKYVSEIVNGHIWKEIEARTDVPALCALVLRQAEALERAHKMADGIYEDCHDAGCHVGKDGADKLRRFLTAALKGPQDAQN